mmetsp:Transcript_7754/g.13773  ORF Transcript_7754/g.13773 Transcript_7754/m.13773 type:complete len:80 (+) Transcript_7754:1367-1606(+)
MRRLFTIPQLGEYIVFHTEIDAGCPMLAKGCSIGFLHLGYLCLALSLFTPLCLMVNDVISIMTQVILQQVDRQTDILSL